MEVLGRNNSDKTADERRCTLIRIGLDGTDHFIKDSPSVVGMRYAGIVSLSASICVYLWMLFFLAASFRKRGANARTTEGDICSSCP